MGADELRFSPVFGDLTDEQLDKLAAIAEPLVLPAGRVVFVQGDPADAFYLVGDGAVKVFKQLRDGRTATIRYVHPGETFGESVLFAATYPSNSETTADSRLLRFSTVAFRRLVIDEPDIGLRLLGAMARLMVMLNQRVEELLLPVPARLARHLLGLCAERGGPPVSGGVTGGSLVCYLPTSKRELAARLGTVPETLSRTLNQLVRSRTIALDGARFEVLDLRALERLAQR
jgi:CRP/FNR family transcriptional regulator